MSNENRVKSKHLFSHLRLEGVYDEEVMKEMKANEGLMKDVLPQMMKAVSIEDDGTAFANMLRALMDGMFSSMLDDPYFTKAMDSCHQDTIKVPPTSYNSHEVEIFVHRPKRLGSGPLPAVIYCHGGGVISGTAHMFRSWCSNMADQFGVVVFNVEYRLAPEAKCPENIKDFYSALKYVVENSQVLKVDPSRVAIWGESGGGYLTAALGVMLAQKNESHLVKLAVPHIPMLDDLCFNDTASMTKDEQGNAPGQRRIWNAIAHNLEAQRKTQDPLLFPAKIPDHLLAKFPPTVIIEHEFDFYIVESTRFAAKLRSAGRLLDFVVIPGIAHASALQPKLKKFHEILDISKKIVQEYLIC